LGIMIVIGFWSRQAAAFLLVFLLVVVWIKWPGAESTRAEDAHPG